MCVFLNFFKKIHFYVYFIILNLEEKIMEIFKIEITETLQKVIEVSAYSLYEALEIIKNKYNNEEIVLDSNDYIDTVIEEYDNK